MNSKVELWVNGTGQTNQGQIDLYGDEPITIQMGNSDIKDIKVRKTNFSQSFVVPGTNNNNQIFNSIFNIGADSYFDARLKTPAYLLVDSIPVMQNGILQLTGIAVDGKENITYQVSIFDEVGDIVDAIGDKELTDLSFSALSHTWTYSAVTATWSGSNQSYFYPLIDYGYDFSVSNMNSGLIGVPITKMFPAIQAKTVLDYIFSAAGYSYTSTFFNSDYFKNLYIPFNGDTNLNNDASFANSKSFHAQKTGATTPTTVTLVSNAPAGTPYNNPQQTLNFNNDSSYPNFDNGLLYDNTTSTYSGNNFTIQTFNVTLNYDITFSSAVDELDNIQVIVYFYRSGYLGGLIPFTSQSNNHALLSASTIDLFSTGPLNATSGPFKNVQPGELFSCKYSFSFDYKSHAGSATATFRLATPNTFFYNIVSTQAVQFQFINYNTFIPKKIKQIDFFNSIITMHNLYIDPNKDNLKSLIIEPRDVYYSGGTQRDWSDKLDESITANEQLLSEQVNKRMIFTYQQDSDFYNDNYNTATKKIFGDYYYVMNNDFTKEDKIIDVIFAPTPSVAVLESGVFVPPGTPTIFANEFVIPKIGKVDSSNHFGSTTYKIRILQKNQSNLVELTGVDRWKLGGVSYTNYPYLGMLDHPSTGTTDIGFGTVDYEYYNLSNITQANLVNTYWKSYLDQISDKDSKLITCNVYLQPSDIQSFSFRDSIFIDGITDDGGHYFIVNSIEYSPTSNQSSKVELIKVKNKFVDITTPINVNNVDGNITLQSLNLAGGVSLSTGSIALGSESRIMQASDNSFVLGIDNTILGSSPRSFIVGSGSTIGSGVQGAIIFGDNISATTGNTLYVPNIIIASGGTINGFPISGLTSGSTSGGTSANLWSASTGSNSIIANNGSGNLASAPTAFAAGMNNSSSGYYSTILNGANNIASNYITTVLNGQQNKATGYGALIGGGIQNSGTSNFSTIINGGSNLSSNYYSFVGNGTANRATGLYSVIIGGGPYGGVILGQYNNKSSGRQSFIGVGKQNSATTTYSTVINGNNNLSSGIFSLIGNGITNSAISQLSSVINGNGNTSSGYASSILNGLNNIASSKYSTILGGKQHITSNYYSNILGGRLNLSSGVFSLVGNGKQNSATTTYSTIINGVNNKISGIFSTITAGSGITSSLVNSNIAENYAVVTGGTNPSAGVAVLVAGSAVVSTTKVTNSSLIFITVQSLGGISSPVGVDITSRTAGTSFTITSASILDTSRVAWWILEPAS